MSHSVEKKKIAALACGLVFLFCCACAQAAAPLPDYSALATPIAARLTLTLDSEPTATAEPPTLPTATPAPTSTPEPAAPTYAADGKYIALTFDDGPHKEYTREILRVLAEHEVSATFFVSGKSAQQWPEILREAVAGGNEIGNHTYSHKDLTKLTPAQVRQQIERTNEIIQDACGLETTLVRPPYGRVSNKIRREFPEYYFALWTIDTRDWETNNTDATVAHVLKKARDGGIVLFHDTKKSTPAAIDPIIRGLKEAGFTIVPLGKLLEMGQA